MQTITIDTSYIRRGQPTYGWGVAVALWQLAAVGANLCNGIQPVDALRFAEIATPTAPASSKNKVYFGADGALYMQNSIGTEISISGTMTTTDILQIQVYRR